MTRAIFFFGNNRVNSFLELLERGSRSLLVFSVSDPQSKQDHKHLAGLKAATFRKFYEPIVVISSLERKERFPYVTRTDRILQVFCLLFCESLEQLFNWLLSWKEGSLLVDVFWNLTYSVPIKYSQDG